MRYTKCTVGKNRAGVGQTLQPDIKLTPEFRELSRAGKPDLPHTVLIQILAKVTDRRGCRVVNQ